EARPLLDTELGNIIRPIFWSPDNRFIAFDAGGKLKKGDIAGGPPQTICDLSAASLRRAWNRDGGILIGSAHRLLRVSAAGGLVSTVTTLDSSRGDVAHAFPVFLPDGKHFLYVRLTGQGVGAIYVGSLDDKPEAQNATALIQSGFAPAYATSQDGPG